ncbi:sensor histidine kinase [Puia sp. P3]|uniref:sensor histidine kinase n=1 Tax=Puia sp. P3 TaxID=3423952 RepID=UPI003D66C26C
MSTSKWLKYAPSKAEFPLTHPDDPDLSRQWGENGEFRKSARDGDSRAKDRRGGIPLSFVAGDPCQGRGLITKWVGTFTDIEDQKQAVRKKDEFISIASHELKTPLTTIKAYVQLLDREIEDPDPNKLYVTRALLQVKKLDDLIVDLLDLSKIESGKLKFNKKLFRVDAMLSNAIDMIRQTYPDYQIVRHGEAGIELYGDEMRIEQVVINYLTNAVKYSPDNKEIHVDAYIDDDDRLYVRVRDFGIGIRKDHQSNIFSKFYRVEESANRFQGLGIGLYICAEIIRRHEGEYGVESEPGEGSTFFFSVPVLYHTN